MTTATDTHRGLTIRQPWAFAIAEGFKTVENRTRRTNYRGPLLIHAGLKPDGAVSIVRYSRDAAIRLDEVGGPLNYWEARALVPSVFHKPHTTLALGAVIATAQLAGCHEAIDGCCAPWGFPDCWHWELTDVRPLRKAVARAGALTLWKADAELLTAVSAAAPRTTTPDVVTVDADGRKHTTIKMKRACNGCGQHLGDVTEQEMARGINGLPLPDVRRECPTCGATAPEPKCLPVQAVDGDEACLDEECDHAVEPGADYCTNTSRHTICVTHSEISKDGAITRAEKWPCKHVPAAVETGE